MGGSASTFDAATFDKAVLGLLQATDDRVDHLEGVAATLRNDVAKSETRAADHDALVAKYEALVVKAHGDHDALVAKYDALVVKARGDHVALLAKYDALLANYDALKTNYETRLRTSDAHSAELRRQLGVQSSLNINLRCELDALRKDPVSATCPICFETMRMTSAHAATPCGHTFCTTCTTRLGPQRKCPKCRAEPVTFIRLFF
jgi:hypothetical protein